MPVPAVLFGDIVADAIVYLRAAILARSESYTDNVTVSAIYGGTPREVTVTRDGGPRRGLFEHPRLRLNIWAATDADATDLANMVLALIMAWPNGSPVVSAATLSGPSAIEEPGARRRYALVELMIRGVQLVPSA
jgi:hypothetical protein